MKLTEEKVSGGAATIKDVAKMAGVSIATVSRILNGTAVVSPDLSEKVRVAIAQLGYYANDVARALKGKESCSIGLIIPDIENPFFPALVRSIEDTARGYDNAIVLCNSDGKVREERRYIEFLYSKRVDGLIFTGGADSAASIELLEVLKIPTVILDRRVFPQKMHSVILDNAYGAQLAVKHLLDAGSKKIAFVGGALGLSVAQERYQGYADTLREHGVALDERLVWLDAFTFDSGYAGMEALLKQDVPFDAVFAGSDIMAFGVIECLQKHKIRVPQDVLVVGYDDVWMSKWYKPSLTTIQQPIYEIGKAAVDLLMEVCSQPEMQLKELKFQPKLIVRNSTHKDIKR